MIALAGRDADAAGAAVTFVEADIRSHVLPVSSAMDHRMKLPHVVCGAYTVDAKAAHGVHTRTRVYVCWGEGGGLL